MDYSVSLNSFEREKLRLSSVAVVGCGGIGGYVVEQLIRMGVGNITVVDGDRFDDSNLNRQLYCTLENLGAFKAEAAENRAAILSPDVKVKAVNEYLTEENAEEILFGCDIVIDALDSLPARRTLHKACSKLGLKLIFGAVGAWKLQVAVLPPCSDFLDELPELPEFHGEAMLPFVPAMCAALQVCEAIKILCGHKSQLDSALLDIDLLCGETIKMEL